jgi:hypothetical protein
MRPSLPAQLLSEAVPPSLAAATVEAAFASTTFTTIQAGAVTASVLALTQGVLSSMKFAPLKWIGLAALTTGLSVGGVVAISQARPQSPRAGGEGRSSTVSVVSGEESSSPQRTASARAEPRSQPADDHEQEIERKIDQLLRDIGFFASDGSDGSPASDGSVVAAKVLKRRMGELLGLQEPGLMTGRGIATSQSAAPTSTTATSTSTVSSPSATTGRTARSSSAGVRNSVSFTDRTVSSSQPRAAGEPSVDARLNADAARNSLPALGVELKLAIDQFDNCERLYQRQVISIQEREQFRGKVLLAAAVLDGLYDELEEQNARFGLEFKRKRAELGQAQARRELAASVVERNRRLDERNPGMLTEEDVLKAQAELKGAEAEVIVKEVEIEELELRREQARRQAKRIKEVVAMADRVRALGPGAAAPTAERGVR